MPTFSLSDKRKICNDINKILVKNNIKEIKVYPKNFKSLTKSPVFWFHPCPFSKYFYSKHVAKLTNIFAYKKATRMIDMLKNDELHLTNLILNEENDPSEYAEVIHRCGFNYPFIPDDYCSQKNNCKQKLCANNNHIGNANNKLPIDDDRKNILVYCFSATFNEKKHWFEYADQDRGCCAQYEFNVSDGFFNPLINYGRIHYDNGYDFEFIKEISNLMRVKHQLAFTPLGITRMAMMYKRDKYRWEDEIRIAVNLKDSTKSSKQLINWNPNMFEHVDIGNDKSVLKIKNSNPYMSWKVKKVIAGGRMSKTRFKQLENICKRNGILFIG